MPAIQSTQPPSSIRPQDLLMEFLSKQTELAIRMSQELQWMSQSLLKRIRRAAADRTPLEGPFNNATKQTLFQIVGAAGSFGWNMAATQASFRANIQLNPLHKAGFDQQAGRMGVMAALFEQATRASGTYLKGSGDSLEFHQQELQQFQQQNMSCQKSVQDTQDGLLGAAKQVISHS